LRLDRRSLCRAHVSDTWLCLPLSYGGHDVLCVVDAMPHHTLTMLRDITKVPVFAGSARPVAHAPLC
jgi:hypothetical protein